MKKTFLTVKGKSVEVRYVTRGEFGWLAVVNSDEFGGEFGDEVPVTLTVVDGVAVIEAKEGV